MQIQSRVRLLMPCCSGLIGNSSKLAMMPIFLQLPRTAARIEIKPGGCTIGRNEMSLCRCPSAMFVSRNHCKLQLQADAKQVQLVHLANNPTLVITADKDTLLLKQGDSVMLSAGDSFSMLADKPSEAIHITWEEPQQQQQQQQQQDLVHAQRDNLSQEHEHVQSQPIMMQQHEPEQLEGMSSQQPLPAIKHVVPKQLHQTPEQQKQQQQQQQVHVQGAQQSWSHEQQQQQQQLDQQREAAAVGASVVVAAANLGKQTQHMLAGQGHTPAAVTSAAAASAAAVPVVSSGRPVMLVLVGLPGSGKSTFAGDLSTLSHQSWVRVNQDTIKGGKRGTREQCMAAAKQAIQAGSNVMVDRCNIDASQRSHFIRLGQQLGVGVHCLVLDVGSGVCMKRAAARIDHEGGVQGKGANRVVGQMNAQYVKAGPPSSIEGFQSLTTCTNPEQVTAALQHWAAAAVGSRKTAPSQQQQQQQQQVVTTLTGESREPPLKKARVDPAAAAAISRQQTHPTQQQQPQRQQHAGSAPAGANAFQLLMQGAKQQQQQQSPAGKNKTPNPRSVASPAAAAGGGSGSSRSGSWSSALTAVAVNPDQYRLSAGVWHIDDQVVGMLDKYPKARCHALLLARQQGLNKVTDLRGPQHLSLLAHMKQKALHWIQQQQQQQRRQQPSGATDAQPQQQQQGGLLEVPPDWRIGFHSIPSMDPLHCHIISNDYDSDALKNKKHWNSFTSIFFLDLDDVMQQLEGPAGRVVVDAAEAEQLLKAPLKCHVCQQQLRNMPELKQHIKTHL